MTVDVMHSATFELHISDAIHSAQTSTEIANEAKRKLIFANGNCVGGSIGLALERPEMQPVGSFILIGQQSVTIQFHKIASFLVHIPLDVFIIQASAIGSCIGERSSIPSAAHTFQEPLVAS